MKNNIIIKISSFLLITIGFVALLIYYSKALPSDGNKSFDWINNFRHVHESESDSSEIIEKSFKVDTNGFLKMKTDIAKIVIESWEKDEVNIVIKKSGEIDRFKNYFVTFSNTSQKVEIIGKYDKKFWDWGSFSVEYIVKVPKNYNFDIDNSAGDIKVSNTKGNIKINSSAGNIILTEIIGDIEADNSAGNIELQSIDGKIHAFLSAGNIVVYPINDNKGIDLESSAGNINLYISKNAKADLDCSASLGNVSLFSDREFNGEIDGNDIHGKLNGGGNRIKAKTSIGNVNISAKK